MRDEYDFSNATRGPVLPVAGKADIIARSLAMHRLIAARIRENPALLERVQDTLSRWRIIVDVRSQPYLAEWQALLDAGLDTLLDFATSESEHAATMRQCSPFCGILTQQERAAFLKDWNDKRSEATHAQR